MTKLKPVRYQRNPNWDINYENGLLLLNAGADEIFALESISEAVAQELLKLWNSTNITTEMLSPTAQDIFEQFKTAGIVLAILPTAAAKPRIAIEFNGQPDTDLLAAIKAELGSDYSSTIAAKADLLVIIRTNARLRDVIAEPYPEIRVPHLFVDLAYSRTISLGPLVFREESACLGCLVGRLTTYWGDAEPPIQPGILNNSGLIAGLVALQIRNIVRQRARELVNHTVSYDFSEHQVRRSSVYKLPLCPICSISTMDTVGAIALPWTQKQ